jgi:hypothetical protein
MVRMDGGVQINESLLCRWQMTVVCQVLPASTKRVTITA